MEIRLFTPDIKEAWDSFVTNAEGGTCYHLSGWKDIFEKSYKHRTYYLFAAEHKNDGKDKVTGILPLVLIKSAIFGVFLVSLPVFDHVGVCACSDEITMSLIEKAIEIAKKVNAGTIVVIFPDRGEKYLSTNLFKE